MNFTVSLYSNYRRMWGAIGYYNNLTDNIVNLGTVLKLPGNTTVIFLLFSCNFQLFIIFEY